MVEQTQRVRLPDQAVAFHDSSGTDISHTLCAKVHAGFLHMQCSTSDKAVCEESYLDACANKLHNVVVSAALQHSNLLANEGFPLLLEHLQSLQALLT